MGAPIGNHNRVVPDLNQEIDPQLLRKFSRKMKESIDGERNELFSVLYDLGNSTFAIGKAFGFPDSSVCNFIKKHRGMDRSEKLTRA